MATEFLPHLAAAVYNWLFENDPKVFLHIAAEHPEFCMNPMPPDKYFQKTEVRSGFGLVTLKIIVLNINPSAINSFVMDDDAFFFNCRMNGTVTSIVVPYKSLLAMSCPDSDLVHHFPIDLKWKFQPESIEERKIIATPVKQQEPAQKARRETPSYLKVVK